MLYGYDFSTVSIIFVYLRMYYCLYLYFQQDKQTDWSVRRIPLGGGGRCHMWPVVVVLELELATETSWDMQPVSCSAADTPSSSSSYFSSSSSYSSSSYSSSSSMWFPHLTIPKLGTTCPKCWDTLSQIWDTVPNVGTSCPDIVRCCPDVGTSCPVLGTSFPVLGTSCLKLGTCCPKFGTFCPKLGTNERTYERTNERKKLYIERSSSAKKEKKYL